MSKTIDFFYEISKIPRESGNEENIANYLCEFAKARNLYYEKDKYNNVIIKKKTSEKTPIILQAHLDMVCEKENGLDIDFEKNPIEIIKKGDFLKANGTTLGADNGIGVAQILNILDSKLKCNIEAIFTVEEETTMIGAEKIDLSDIESKQMINLDGFEEDTIIIESASFFDIILKQNYNFESEVKEKIYKINLEGLLGGHSGFDINKNRGNAGIILAEFLKKIEDIKILNFISGTKFNVIPSSAECIFISNKELKCIKNDIDNFLKDKKKEYEDLKVFINELSKVNNLEHLSNKDSIKFIDSIFYFKHGVFCENNRKEVTTSINLGVVDLKKQVLKVGMRSSRKEEESKCLSYIKQYCLENKFEFVLLGSQPGFETKEESSLVKKLQKSYKNINENKEPSIKSVHITVETGFFKEKIKNLEVAIISPKILNAHTPNECVSIESVNRCDKWLRDFLINY